MAAMTSPQPEGVVIDQRDIKMASLGDTQPPASNGVNGHPSPVATPPESASELNGDRKASALSGKIPSPDLPDSNHVQIQNHESFTTNQTVLPDLASPAEKSIALVEKPSEEIQPLVAEKSDDAVVDAPVVAAPADGPESLGPAEPIIPPAAEPSPASAAPVADSLPESVPVDLKVDVEMSDAAPASVPDPVPTEVAEPEQAESTQATGISEAAATPATGDLSLHPASMSNLALDGSQDVSSAPPTADTSMTDAPSQIANEIVAKVAREREDDEDLDEPSAKRARTEDREAPAEQIEVQLSQPNVDEMAVDQPGEQATAQAAVVLPPRELPAGVVATPNTLSDPAQEGKPITQFANREIRKVLASVKKTKAGGFFKDPVKVKWPDLWDAYIAKIDKPVDISSMEKNLRENKYTTLGELINEVYLIRENAIKFNGPEHMVTGQAKGLVDNILTRFVDIPLEEPPKSEKKEVKQIATRHAEPRAAAVQARRESRGAVASPTDEIVDSPVYAVPASGVPIIRRDSTINEGDRPKRPIKRPKDKDLGFEPKNLKKKKQSPDFRFCDEVLKELTKQKHWGANQWFKQPVDPVRDGIPNYFNIIKKPMDLETMQKKLSNGEYNSAKDFESDFYLIIKNCKKFNTPDSVVTKSADQLEQLFKQKWAEKDEWISSHAPAAPPSVAASSPAAHDSDDEGDASGPEAEEEVAVESSATLEALNNRLNEEQGRLNDLLNDKIPNTALIATQQGLLAMLQKSLIDEKLKLAETAKKTKKPAKPKASKPKKAASGASAVGKKAGGAGASGGSKKAGGGKKSTKPARVMGQAEKNAVAEGINNLEGHQLEKAIDIIKKDTNQEESASGELELDIDQLSQEALGKLYDLVVKTQPETKKKVEKARAVSPPEPAAQAKSSKPKKHKPMGKAEQERSIEKLREIKAQFQRPGSGSQEPLPSVEGNQPRDEESDDESEVDSEED